MIRIEVFLTKEIFLMKQYFIKALFLVINIYNFDIILYWNNELIINQLKYGYNLNVTILVLSNEIVIVDGLGMIRIEVFLTKEIFLMKQYFIKALFLVINIYNFDIILYWNNELIINQLKYGYNLNVTILVLSNEIVIVDGLEMIRIEVFLTFSNDSLIIALLSLTI